MFYESHHPLTVDYFKILRGENISYIPHMHYCYEMILVSNGCLHVKVDSKEYLVHAGEGVLIFPHQMHHIHTEEYNQYVLCLFTPELIKTYHTIVESKIPVSNLFRWEPFYAPKIHALTDHDSILAIKGLLYTLCDAFDKNNSYIAYQKNQYYLLPRMIHFIEQNYSDVCTLYALSRNLGYEYSFLSSYFKKTTGMSYGDYVNQYRINQACYLLRESDMPVTLISQACGFPSHRTFNRNFKDINGISPVEYRKQHSSISS